MTTQLPHAPAKGRGEGFWLRIIVIVSALVVGAVAFLILGPRPAGTEGRLDVSMLPTVNACFNAATAVLLVTGLVLAKKRRFELHKRVMLGAFGTSTAFLVTYLLYHWFKAGQTRYEGALRPLYLFILSSHSILAAVIVPLALLTLYRGYVNDRARHRKIAKWTLPLWLYVSVTGVVVYAMLYL